MRTVPFFLLGGFFACEPAPEESCSSIPEPNPTIEIISDVNAYGFPILHLEDTLSGGARGKMLLHISEDFETLYVALFLDEEADRLDYYEARYPETVISLGFLYDIDLLDGRQARLEIGALGSKFQIEQFIWIEYHSDYEN